MRTYGWVTIVLACVSVAQAQERDSLTLTQVYALLDQGTPRLQAAAATARAAEERIAPAGRLPDPEIQLGIMNRSLPGLGLDPVLGMNQLQLMQMIPIAGQLGLSRRVARAEADAADARAAEARWSERARAAMEFYELYRLDQGIRIARTTQRLVRDIVTTTEAMYAVGEGRQPDVLRAQVELARMDEELVRMGAMRDAAAARLNAVLNRPTETPVPSPLLPTFPDQFPTGDSLVRLALATRPMLEAGAAQVRAAEFAERRARREIWPDLRAGVQYGWRGMDGGTDHMVSLMLGVTLPVSAGSRQFAMRREAQAMREMAQADLAAMRADTRGRVGELVATISSAESLLTLYRHTVLPQSEATVASSQSAYRTGSVDFLTLLDAQMSLNRYRQEVVALEAELGQSIAELEMVTGSPLLPMTQDLAGSLP